MYLFYTTEISADQIILTGDEAHHAMAVLRKRPGDRLTAVDGRGGWYEAVLEEVGKKRCTARIEQHLTEFGKRDFQVHIGIAPTKNIARMEWFLEKATEIGVEEITPILCRHSERKDLRIDRLQKILVAAMKQSLKAYLPRLNPLTPFPELVGRQESQPEQKFIAYCAEDVKEHLKENYLPGRSVTILIGPEGDFAPQEVKLAHLEGFQPISLGESRYRTETAGMVACLIVQLSNE